MLPAICLITAHPNPANHFAEYVQVFEERSVPCKVIAGKSVSDRFSRLKSHVVVIDPLSLDDEEFLSQLEKEITSQSIVITDIANEQWAALHQMLSQKYPFVKRAVYYDNPERYVPGGYSQLAAKIIDKAQTILFANSFLAQKGIEIETGILMDISEKEVIGIGYYPKEEAEKILQLKQQKKCITEIRSSFFERHGIAESNQKIFIYAGGANDVYYNKAFPHFLSLASELINRDNSPLKNTVFVLQQHPRAKAEGNLDASLVERFLLENKLPNGFHFVVSDMPTIESLAIADGVLYYQTSMAAQFVFGQIPSVIQVGHETYSDVLVRAGFPSAMNSDQLAEALSNQTSSANLQLLEAELGIDPTWKDNLLKINNIRSLAVRNYGRNPRLD